MSRGREQTADEFFRLESELEEIARAGRATPEVAEADSGISWTSPVSLEANSPSATRSR